MGIVRFFSLPKRLVSLVPSEQPLPKLKPQPPRTLKVFSAYSRCVARDHEAVLVVGDRHHVVHVLDLGLR